MSDESKWLAQVLGEMGSHVYFWNAGVSDDSFAAFAEEVTSSLPNDDGAIGYLVLTTNGGQADSAYRSIRLMHEIFNEVVVVVPSYCKSAGTLMVLGAHKLEMSLISELGPLDVQIRETDELFQVRSGLNSNSAFEALSQQSYELFSDLMLKIKTASNNAVSFKLSSEIASQITSELMKPIYSQINPRAIGSDFRKLHTATEYGQRLAKISNNLKGETLQKLVSGYPDHGFVIDYREAQELFTNVNPAKSVFFEMPASLKYLTMPLPRNECVIGLNNLMKKYAAPPVPNTANQETKDDEPIAKKKATETPSQSADRMDKKLPKKRKSD